MLVEVEVQNLGMDRATRSPVVVLGERGGDRVLPIWIGAAEASAIAMHLAGVDFPRPLTHDLAVSLIEGLGAALVRVEIPEVDDGTYHATLVLQRGKDRIRVDARPSDSIAIAIRARATVVVADDLLRQMTLEIDEAESAIPSAPQAGDDTSGSEPSDSASMSAQELAEHLRRLDPEDFGRFTP